MSNHFFAPIISAVAISPVSGPGGTLFAAEVTATGRPNVRLTYQWHLDGVTIAGATRPTFTSFDAGKLTVHVTGVNNQGSDTRISEPAHVCLACGLPEILEVAIIPEAGRVGDIFAATVRVAGAPSPSVSYQWLLDGRQIPGAVQASYAPITPGVLSVLVTAANAEGSVTRESDAVAVTQDLAPTIESLRLAPASGRVGDVFEAVANLAGTEPIAIAYQWLADGAAIPGATGPSFAATAAGALSVRLTATNAAGTAAAESAPAEVAAPLAAPHITVADIVPNTGRVGDTFVVTAEASGEPAPELRFQWFLDDVEIAGVTGPAYTAEAEGALFVRIIATNVAGTDTRESGTVGIKSEPVAPAITSASLSPDAGRVGDVFAAIVSATGHPEPTLTFAWYLDGAPIAEATGDSYRADATGLLAAEVTATNAAGSARRMTPALSVAPALAAPALDAIWIEPESGRVGDRFAARVEARGEPKPDLAFRWTLDGIDIPGADSDALVAEAPGRLAVEVTATSIAGTDTGSTAVDVAPALAAPAIRSATITPEAGVVGDLFTVTADASGAPEPVLTYQWLLDGAPVDGATGPSIGAPAPGALAVRVTAANALGTAAALAEPAAVTPAPMAPVVTLADIVPEAGEVGETFAILASATGYPMPSLSYAWLLDGAVIAKATGATLTATTPGTLSARVRATNAAGSDDRDSAAVTVSEAARTPRIESLAIEPDTGRVGDTFTARLSATGHPVPTVAYQWSLDGTPLPGATAATYVPVAPGALRVTAIAQNAAGTAQTETAAVTVAPADTAPSVFVQGVFEPGVFA